MIDYHKDKFGISKESGIDRLQLTSSLPCWMTINKRTLISFIVPVIQHGRQGLCHLNLSGMVANHLYLFENHPLGQSHSRNEW